MRRRDVIAILGALPALRHAAAAQSADRVRRLGMLMGTTQSGIAVFVGRLRELGWTDGENLRIEYRWAAGDADRMRAYAAELVGLSPDAIVSESTPGLIALKRETRTIPIVFTMLADPVGSGLVESLSRPGGNVTGFTTFEPSMGSKWLEVMKEIAPKLARVAVILHPRTPPNVAFLRAIEAVAPSLALTVSPIGLENVSEIESTIAAFAAQPNGGLIVLPHILTVTNRELIIQLAARHRLPAVYPFGHFATAGGLIAYGIDAPDVWRRAAPYVDRILRGGHPGGLPVQQPIKFELVINLRTARELGLTVPRSLLGRANEVIE